MLSFAQVATWTTVLGVVAFVLAHPLIAEALLPFVMTGFAIGVILLVWLAGTMILQRTAAKARQAQPARDDPYSR